MYGQKSGSLKRVSSRKYSKNKKYNPMKCYPLENYI